MDLWEALNLALDDMPSLVEYIKALKRQGEISSSSSDSEEEDDEIDLDSYYFVLNGNNRLALQNTAKKHCWV